MAQHLSIVHSDSPQTVAEPRDAAPATSTLPVLGTVADVAREYGLPKSSLYALLNQNIAPGRVQIGRRILIHRAVFAEWVKRQAEGAQQ